MKIISFAWTTAALLAGAKTVTRREWNDSYAKSFKEGELVQAWDKLPRAGGKQVAVIEITRDPYQERVGSAPLDDYAAEGLEWMAAQGMTIQGMRPLDFWGAWLEQNPLVWVVRFKVVQ